MKASLMAGPYWVEIWFGHGHVFFMGWFFRLGNVGVGCLLIRYLLFSWACFHSLAKDLEAEILSFLVRQQIWALLERFFLIKLVIY